jgi:hypothetical protein
MAMMGNYKPRRAAPQPMSIASNEFSDNGMSNNMEDQLLSNPAQYAKKSYLEDMIASVPQQDPYMADLETQLSKMFDETEILPKEYMNG